MSDVDFLGYIASANGKEWPVPKSVKHVEEFLRFSNFYRRFIEDFVSIARPLTELTKNTTPWLWDRGRQDVFDELKKRFCEERIFAEGQLKNGDTQLLLCELYIEEDIDDVYAPDFELDIDCSTWQKASNGLLIVPPEHRQAVLRQCHDSQVAGHWGKHRTQELISRDFTWERCRESCPKCQKSKSDRHSRQTRLIPMPTGSKPWEEIALDFVGELPESEGYNAILVITDHFTKMQQNSSP